MIKGRNECLHCEKNIKGLPQKYQKRYCLNVCSFLARYRIMYPEKLKERWTHDKQIFENAMEMYWNGLSRAEIVKCCGMPARVMDSWVHFFGRARKRGKPGKSLGKQFRVASSADEWLTTLRESTTADGDTFEDIAINLVCGTLRGQSAGKLAAIVAESLKEDPTSGKSYAFCSKGRNIISVLAWKAPVFQISKYVKIHGTFIWPGEELGRTIEISRTEFDRLIFLEKCKKSSLKLLEETSQICITNTINIPQSA